MGSQTSFGELIRPGRPTCRDVREQFFPKENLRRERLRGLDEAMADAVTMKCLPALLSKAQQDELFKYYARGSPR